MMVHHHHYGGASALCVNFVCFIFWGWMLGHRTNEKLPYILYVISNGIRVFDQVQVGCGGSSSGGSGSGSKGYEVIQEPVKSSLVLISRSI